MTFSSTFSHLHNLPLSIFHTYITSHCSFLFTCHTYISHLHNLTLFFCLHVTPIFHTYITSHCSFVYISHLHSHLFPPQKSVAELSLSYYFHDIIIIENDVVQTTLHLFTHIIRFPLFPPRFFEHRLVLHLQYICHLLSNILLTNIFLVFVQQRTDFSFNFAKLSYIHNFKMKSAT